GNAFLLRHRELAQELASDARFIRYGIKDQLRADSHSKLDTIVADQLALGHAFFVHVSAELAAVVDDEEIAFLADDLSMVARDAGIGDLEVLARLPADGERHQRQRHVALLRSKDETDDRKDWSPGGTQSTGRTRG